VPAESRNDPAHANRDRGNESGNRSRKAEGIGKRLRATRRKRVWSGREARATTDRAPGQPGATTEWSGRSEGCHPNWDLERGPLAVRRWHPVTRGQRERRRVAATDAG
jgi:hypothetical protein